MSPLLQSDGLVSDFIPADLVRVEVDVEGAAVATVDGSGLRLVGVVDDAVLAVLDVGVDLDVVVRAEPAVELILAGGGPKHGAVEDAVVLEGVGQA